MTEAWAYKYGSSIIEVIRNDKTIRVVVDDVAVAKCTDWANYTTLEAHLVDKSLVRVYIRQNNNSPWMECILTVNSFIQQPLKYLAEEH